MDGQLTAHVVVSSSGSSAASPSEALVASPPSPPVEVASAVWAAPHGAVAPVVAVVSAATSGSGRRAHHAGAGAGTGAAGVEGWPVAMWGRGVVVVWAAGGLVGRVTSVHGHVHIHTHAHIHVHTGTMAQKTGGHCRRNTNNTRKRLSMQQHNANNRPAC